MLDRSGTGAGADARLRVLRVLWAAFFSSVGVYALVGGVAAPGPEAGSAAGGLPPLLYALLALGAVLVAVSFAVRRSFYRRAASARRPELVQTGLILALAFCEAAALLGLAALFVVRSPAAYLLFALGAFGHLLHFPRREQLAAASADDLGGLTSSLR